MRTESVWIRDRDRGEGHLVRILVFIDIRRLSVNNGYGVKLRNVVVIGADISVPCFRCLRRNIKCVVDGHSTLLHPS